MIYENNYVCDINVAIWCEVNGLFKEREGAAVNRLHLLSALNDRYVKGGFINYVK